MSDRLDVYPGAKTESGAMSGEPHVINAPYFSSSTIQLFLALQECVLVFGRNRPAQAQTPDGQMTGVAVPEAVCIVSLNMHATKDLATMLSRMVRDFEKEWGTLDTDYQRQRAATDNK